MRANAIYLGCVVLVVAVSWGLTPLPLGFLRATLVLVAAVGVAVGVYLHDKSVRLRLWIVGVGAVALIAVVAIQVSLVVDLPPMGDPPAGYRALTGFALTARARTFLHQEGWYSLTRADWLARSGLDQGLFLWGSSYWLAEIAYSAASLGFVACATILGGTMLQRPFRPTAEEGRDGIFISYTHDDAPTALRLRDALRQRGIRVIIDVDVDAVHAGEDIATFIARAVRESAITFTLVSSESLLSGWVADEGCMTLFAERLGEVRRYVAGFLDEAFLDLGFQLRATETIDARLREIDALAAHHAKKGIDSASLDATRQRLYALRANLGTILARLRAAATLDLREPRFTESVEKLVALAGSQRPADAPGVR